MKCTIQNIADHLGLSRNTVSKALKNSSEVSENTRNLVIKTASKLGYKNATFATPVIPASETGSNGTILFLTRTYASDLNFGPPFYEELNRFFQMRIIIWQSVSCPTVI